MCSCIRSPIGQCWKSDAVSLFDAVQPGRTHAPVKLPDIVCDAINQFRRRALPSRNAAPLRRLTDVPAHDLAVYGALVSVDIDQRQQLAAGIVRQRFYSDLIARAPHLGI